MNKTMTVTALYMVDKKELEKVVPTNIWKHAYPFIMSAYDDKDSISITDLMSFVQKCEVEYEKDILSS